MSIQQRRPTLALLSVAAACSLLASGCSSTNPILGEKVDYRKTGTQTVNLDVPPDLSKLPGQSRYGQMSPAIVSANSVNAPTAAAASTSTVAPGQFGTVKLERQGQTRWLSVNQAPEQVWETVRQFWLDSGFELTVDQPEAGLLETNWAENRAKLPQDFIRKTVGTIMDGLYDTGERDQFKIRVERTSKGSEIYVTHRGVVEEYANSQKTETRWQPRTDVALESEMLARLMVKLGAGKDAADQVRAQTTATAPVATGSQLAKLTDSGVALLVNDDAETVWRRVGLALDRSGYTIETRERVKGTFDVKLPGENADANKPGFWSRVFGGKQSDTPAVKHRVVVKASTNRQSLVEITDRDGAVQNTATAKRIAKDLLTELQ
ncbi:MAG: outer membrane protein assembly factor BamC [Aquabacterium sp.]